MPREGEGLAARLRSRGKRGSEGTETQTTSQGGRGKGDASGDSVRRSNPKQAGSTGNAGKSKERRTEATTRIVVREGGVHADDTLRAAVAAASTRRQKEESKEGSEPPFDELDGSSASDDGEVFLNSRGNGYRRELSARTLAQNAMNTIQQHEETEFAGATGVTHAIIMELGLRFSGVVTRFDRMTVQPSLSDPMVWGTAPGLMLYTLVNAHLWTKEEFSPGATIFNVRILRAVSRWGTLESRQRFATQLQHSLYEMWVWVCFQQYWYTEAGSVDVEMVSYELQSYIDEREYLTKRAERLMKDNLPPDQAKTHQALVKQMRAMIHGQRVEY